MNHSIPKSKRFIKIEIPLFLILVLIALHNAFKDFWAISLFRFTIQLLIASIFALGLLRGALHVYDYEFDKQLEKNHEYITQGYDSQHGEAP
ncbi:hypothetical protein [Acinetobacter ursingii]|uniref:hypothetical protein n=1 Tax=Acinetobacter ursingii TaxID=108980 RepID=UPI0012508BDA|nr:hypothetical protein [Acinetobacter ursingii]